MVTIASTLTFRQIFASIRGLCETKHPLFLNWLLRLIHWKREMVNWALFSSTDKLKSGKRISVVPNFLDMRCSARTESVCKEKLAMRRLCRNKFS